MTSVDPVPLLLPLSAHPATDPVAWRRVAGYGPRLTVVAKVPPEDPDVVLAVHRLVLAGVAVLGHVDTVFATRPVADLLRDVVRWLEVPVAGIFLDQTPTSPFSVGPVAMAVRTARQAGLDRVVLNPGAPPDPLYRQLGAAVCSFEGDWDTYRRWDGEGSTPGDGHLVHSVPVSALPAAWRMLRVRGAGFGVVSDRTPPDPYAGLPSPVAPPTMRSRTAGRASTDGRAVARTGGPTGGGSAARGLTDGHPTRLAG